MLPFSLNIKGNLIEYTRPAVMGILNVTPDSFYPGSRVGDMSQIRAKVAQMIEEGADIIDVGAFSTRPGFEMVSAEQESDRICFALDAIRQEFPSVPVSVDTFRSEVAYKAVAEMGADIINDISGGNFDPQIFDVAASLHVPYVLSHCQGDVTTMHSPHTYTDLLADIVADLALKVSALSLKGVCDIIIDPGFGFSKSLEQNFALLRGLNALDALHLPILVGLSRKSMVTKPLGIAPDEAANGSTVLHTIALLQGASILRVHDVRDARQAIDLLALCAPQGVSSLWP